MISSFFTFRFFALLVGEGDVFLLPDLVLLLLLLLLLLGDGLIDLVEDVLQLLRRDLPM